MSGEDPWTAYLARLDALAEAARPAPWSAAEVTAEDLIFFSLATPAIRRLVAEVRRLRGSFEQHGCGETAAYRFTWPGHDESVICETHVQKLHAVASAMGLPLQVIPLAVPPPEMP